MLGKSADGGIRRRLSNSYAIEKPFGLMGFEAELHHPECTR